MGAVSLCFRAAPCRRWVSWFCESLSLIASESRRLMDWTSNMRVHAYGRYCQLKPASALSLQQSFHLRPYIVFADSTAPTLMSKIPRQTYFHSETKQFGTISHDFEARKTYRSKNSVLKERHIPDAGSLKKMQYRQIYLQKFMRVFVFCLFTQYFILFSTYHLD